MNVNEVPKMNMDLSETKCCPKFNPEGWDNRTIVFDKKKFVKMQTRNFMHVPLNMAKVLGEAWKKVEAEGAGPKDYYLLLTHDPSPWKSDHYMAVTKDVPGLETTELSGTYLTKVFEGPYKEVRNWVGEMEKLVDENGKKMKRLYFFYTTCPKCLKHYGKITLSDLLRSRCDQAFRMFSYVFMIAHFEESANLFFPLAIL